MTAYDTIRYSRDCGSYQDFLDRGLLLRRKLLNHEWNWSHHFESFTLLTMTVLTALEYLCHQWPRNYSTCRKHFPVLSSLMTYHRLVTRLRRRVSLEEYELHTLLEHLRSILAFSGVRVTRSFVLYVCFVDRCLSLCSFLLVIVLSVLLWNTDNDYDYPLVSSNYSCYIEVRLIQIIPYIYNI